MMISQSQSRAVWFNNRGWTRRAWLTHQTLGMAVLVPWSRRAKTVYRSAESLGSLEFERLTAQSTQVEPGPWQALAQRAVDAARGAGARYAEARLIRTVQHTYNCSSPKLQSDDETVGVGVRVLVDGYWGFSASALITPDEVVRLAQDAVRQAKGNARGPAWTVDLGHYPIATGTWTTPIRLDPFGIPIEEKIDFIAYWKQCAEDAGTPFLWGGSSSWLAFGRQERVVATSEGALFTQTLYESGGELIVQSGANPLQDPNGITQTVHGVTAAGAGWERFLDASIPEQFRSGRLRGEMDARAGLLKKPAAIGKYALVCDGATMAALVEATLGVATQLDRALGYEANVGGTSWLEDPLGMVGVAQVAAPGVTLTANRSAPQELATVRWDEEGVEPEEFSLIRDGVLVDFQTTREQAVWLAPYYQQHNLPVRSHGCAGVEDAHVIPLQHMPNLSLTPNPSALRLEDLVADVNDGILVEGGEIAQSDQQAGSGLLLGRMREIKHGKLGKGLNGGAVLYDSQELWKSVKTIGGAMTVGEVGWSNVGVPAFLRLSLDPDQSKSKGEPPQQTSHTVRAAAAIIANQALIDPARKI